MMVLWRQLCCFGMLLGSELLGDALVWDLHLSKGWNAVSFPMDPVSSDPVVIFGTDVTVMRFDTDRKRYQEPDRIVAGEGYYAYSRSVEMRQVSLRLTNDRRYRRLSSGWSMIGSVTISKDLPLVLPLRALLLKGRRMRSVTEVLPGQAVWVYTKKPVSILLSPNPALASVSGVVDENGQARIRWTPQNDDRSDVDDLAYKVRIRESQGERVITQRDTSLSLDKVGMDGAKLEITAVDEDGAESLVPLVLALEAFQKGEKARVGSLPHGLFSIPQDAGLLLPEGASIRVDRFTLRGVLQADAATVRVDENLDAAGGVFEAPAGRLVLDGGQLQHVALDRAEIGEVSVVNSSQDGVVFSGQLETAAFTAVGAKSVSFQPGSELSVREELILEGTASAPLAFTSAVSGQPWFLQMAGGHQSIRHLTVADNDASRGFVIRPSESVVRSGNTVNWLFPSEPFENLQDWGDSLFGSGQ